MAAAAVSPSLALASAGADLSQAVALLSRGTVLVVGDAMVDRYIYGHVSRVSPEAPVPVLTVEREVALPGGAGNVVRNLTALGAAVAFVSVVGDDAAGSDLTGLIGGQPRVEPWLLVQGGRATTTKTRFVAAGQHLLRADHEQSQPIHPRLADRLVKIATDAVAATATVVLSDYGKGVLSGEVAQRLILAAHAAGRRVVVDPKGGDHARFAGADLIIPECDELRHATGLPCTDAATVAAAATMLRRTHRFGAVLVPRGPEGLTLIQDDGAGGEAVTHLRAEASDVHDPAGSGDAVVAVVAAGLAAGLPLASVSRLAALALGIVSRKSGIALVRAEELTEALAPGRGLARKLASLPLAHEVMERWRHRGWRVGFLNITGGDCPASLTEQARQWCDRLVVAVPEGSGLEAVLSERPEVDMIALTNGIGAEDLIRRLRPDVLVGDVLDTVLAELLSEWGGEMRCAA
ncbi:MAG: bifunctional hydroxymethylpyrimidine kinase/phosphomethylpyrimidine kinase [Acetobacteraceae bacterium]|nr:bifunctional hydroxymethylpyrimidine kinase/phosphomethylpyrimidine kinase [Acetobacteraceae bacterium]